MELPLYHRLRGPYLRLEGQRCEGCKTIQFPPRRVCSNCRDARLAPHRLSGRGAVYSFSEVGQAPSGFGAPYLVALVRLEEGMLVAAQLTDVEADKVTIGMPVEAVTRRIRELDHEGFLVYAYKFRPGLASS